MRFARLSIAQMMLLILLITAGVACLLRPTRLAAALAVSVTLLALVMTTVAAIFGRFKSRPFTVGFLIGGWASVAIHYSSLFSPLVSSYLYTSQQLPATMLPTTAFLDVIYPHLFSDAYQPSLITPAASPPYFAMPVPNVSTSYTYWVQGDRVVTLLAPMRSFAFLQIGYAIFTWIFAFAIGCWASWLASRRDETAAKASP